MAIIDSSLNKNKAYGISSKVISKLCKENNSMLAFAVHNGIAINTEIIGLVQSDSIDDLIHAHNLLCKNVSPATPKSIKYSKQLYLYQKDKPIYNKLPLVRNLVILALFFLTTFVLTGVSPYVNNDSLDKGVMHNHGFPLFLNMLYLTSISGLGAIFYLLKKGSSAIKNGTLVSEDRIYYVTLIILGIISGLVMSEIISMYIKDPTGINLFNKSMLALIGGFSSDVIFCILEGTIDRIKMVLLANGNQNRGETF